MPTRQKDKKLLAAVMAGDFPAINKCIENQANPNVLDENKTPVLHLVVQSTNLCLSYTCKIIILLIEQGAQVNLVDKSGKTAVDHARKFQSNQALKMIHLLQENGAMDAKQESKYFTYKDNIYTNHSRPNNQSTPVVQQKIAARITRNVDENRLKMTTMQKLFAEEVMANAGIKKGCRLKDQKIDIAHNIASSKLAEVIADKLNSVPNTLNDEKFTAFAEDLLSTDDESGKKKASQIFHNLSDPAIPVPDKLQEATILLEHMNRASRNLMPGHMSPNRALQDHRDAHLMLSRGGLFIETPVSIKLSDSINTLFRKTYDRRTRTVNGERQYQSSSVGENKDNSWY